MLAPGPVIVVASPGLAGEMISVPDSSEIVELGGSANVIVSLPATVLALSTAVRSVQLVGRGAGAGDVGGAVDRERRPLRGSGAHGDTQNDDDGDETLAHDSPSEVWRDATTHVPSRVKFSGSRGPLPRPARPALRQ